MVHTHTVACSSFLFADYTYTYIAGRLVSLVQIIGCFFLVMRCLFVLFTWRIPPCLAVLFLARAC